MPRTPLLYVLRHALIRHTKAQNLGGQDVGQLPPKTEHNVEGGLRACARCVSASLGASPREQSGAAATRVGEWAADEAPCALKAFLAMHTTRRTSTLPAIAVKIIYTSTFPRPSLQWR